MQTGACYDVQSLVTARQYVTYSLDRDVALRPAETPVPCRQNAVTKRGIALMMSSLARIAYIKVGYSLRWRSGKALALRSIGCGFNSHEDKDS